MVLDDKLKAQHVISAARGFLLQDKNASWVLHQTFWMNKHPEPHQILLWSGAVNQQEESFFGFIFTPIYQPDCSRDQRRWPLTSGIAIMLTADWSWRGNITVLLRVNGTERSGRKKRGNLWWVLSWVRGWPEFKHRHRHTHLSACCRWLV